MSLQTLGWNEYFQQAYAAFAGPEKLPARVIAEYRGQYLIHTGNEELSAEVSGALHFRCTHDSDFPKVGDWVVVTRYAVDKALIHECLPRTTSVSRRKAGRGCDEQVMASNITVMAVVMGLDGDFNLRRLERYLALAKTQQCRSLVILNKADLLPEDHAHLASVRQTVPEDQLLVVSALNTVDIERIRACFSPGDTAVLLGSSGAGKSTIVNGLLGDERQRTTAVREDDARGRHTTTHRELFMVSGDFCIIDSPGIRELQLWDGGDTVLAEAFADIAALAAACRFTDCRHEQEPGCAVRAALENGTLEQKRFANYRKLQKEMQYQTMNSREIENKKIENMLGSKSAYKKMRRMYREQ